MAISPLITPGPDDPEFDLFARGPVGDDGLHTTDIDPGVRGDIIVDDTVVDDTTGDTTGVDTTGDDLLGDDVRGDTGLGDDIPDPGDDVLDDVTDPDLDVTTDDTVVDTDEDAIPDVVDPGDGATDTPEVDTGLDIPPLEITADQTVAGQLASLFGENSPVLEYFKSQGVQAAANRGLQNSLLAEKMGIASMMQVALPIASQDAATAAQAAMASYGYQMTAELALQGFEQQWQLAQQLHENASSMSYQEYVQALSENLYAFQYQSTLLAQQLANDLNLSDQEQAELLEVLMTNHTNALIQMAAQAGYDLDELLAGITAQGDVDAMLADLAHGFNMDLQEVQNTFTLIRDAALSALRIEEMDAALVNELEIIIQQGVTDGELMQLAQDFNIELSEVQNTLAIIRDNNTLTNTLAEMDQQLVNDLQILAAQEDTQVLLQNMSDLHDITMSELNNMLAIVRDNNTLQNTISQMDEALLNDLELISAQTTSQEQLAELALTHGITLAEVENALAIVRDNNNQTNILEQMDEALLNDLQVIAAQGDQQVQLEELANTFNVEMAELTNTLAMIRDSNTHANTLEQMNQGLINELMLLDSQEATDARLMGIANAFDITLAEVQNGLDIIRDYEQSQNALDQMDQSLVNQLAVIGVQHANTVDLQDLAHQLNLDFAEVQNTFTMIRDAQLQLNTLETLGVQLQNDLAIIQAQTVAAMDLSHVDQIEAMELMGLQSIYEIRAIQERSDATQEEMDLALSNLLTEILARTDAAQILSALDFQEALDLAAKNEEIAENL
jgi:hypothetical protein